MKLKFFSIESRFKYIFHWILIYIIVIIFGVCFSLAATYYNNKHMHHIAKYDMDFYMEHNYFNPNVKVNGAYNFIFDHNGKLIDACPDKNIGLNWEKYAKKILPDVIQKKEYYGITLNPKHEKYISIVTAYPTTDDGLFLFVREPPFFKKTIIIIAVTVALLLVMFAIYIYMMIEIQQKNQKMQRDYIDNITHELKSPIASVRALTETMYDGLVRDEEKRKRYYKIILNEMSGLENTVSSMLELSKIQNHQIDCSKALTSASEAFSNIIEKYDALCSECGIRFSIAPPLNKRQILFTNTALASRMMDILLDNAVKFAPEKGSIHVEFEEDDTMLTISISDNGTGIAPDDQNMIFHRFYKGDKSHNEKGSGLGLSIASEIADSLNEKLWLRYTGPNGTAFAFTIHKN